jgi:hypothetical protein
LFGDIAGAAPTHDTINLAGVDSPCGKYFIYLHINDYNIVEPYVVGKEMVFDSGADSANEFVAINSSNAATDPVVNTLYSCDGTLTSALRNGVWLNITATTISFDSTAWVKGEDGNIYHNTSGGTVYFVPWDGNGFGDSNKFSIVDGEAYETDYNGNTIKVLCHKINLPFQIYLPRTIKES